MLGVCKGHCLYSLLSFSFRVPPGHVLLWLLITCWSCSRGNQELRFQRNTHTVTTFLIQEADIWSKQKCKHMESSASATLLPLLLFIYHAGDRPVVNGTIMMISYRISFIRMLFRSKLMLCKEQPWACNNTLKNSFLISSRYIIPHHKHWKLVIPLDHDCLI